MGITPILKIRLKRLTRHPFKSLFKYFYSTIFLGLAAIIYVIINWGRFFYPPIKVNVDSSLGIENLLKTHKSFLQDLKGFCIVSQEETQFAKDFSNFIEDHFKNKSTFLQLDEFNQNKPRCQEYLVLNVTQIEDKINIKVEKDSKILLFEVLSNILGLESSTYKAKILVGIFLKEEFLDKGKKVPEILMHTENLSSSKTFAKVAFALLVILRNIVLFFSFTLWIVSEKQGNLENFLKRQGVTFFQYSMSWLVVFFVITIIPLLLNAFFVFVTIDLRIIGWLLLVGIQLVSNLSMFGLILLIGTIINKTQTAQSILKLFYAGIFILVFIFFPKNSEKIIYLLFIPQINEIISFDLFFDDFHFGSYKNSFFSYSSSELDLNYLICSLFFVGTFIVYFIISLVISYCKASGYFSLRYIKSVTKNNPQDNEQIPIQRSKFELHHEPPTEKNMENKNNNNYLSINGVYKYFGPLAAVNGFTGELFPDEIFCLLGHNGAGKTTLINIISGQENPNEGNIFLDGTDILINKNFLFRNIGVCTQEDIFFEYLTVKEHLEYMSLLKGVKINNTEVTDLINRIGLNAKENAICSTLSGGEKRKLCISLALIGNSKLVLLDEPTSGMDVFAKRYLWQFLKGYKENKIIILTTHSLDEAECLGDKIGIMSEGEYVCSGTSSYLKSQYPCGYNINLIINDKVCTQEVKLKILEHFKEFDQTAKLKISSKYNVSYNLMKINEDVKNIFDFIESKKEEYGIENYTITTTSLEDVFLSINHSDDEFNSFYNDTNSSSNSMNINENSGALTESLNLQEEKLLPKTEEVQFSCCEKCQYLSNLVRYFKTFYRNIKIFIFELLSSWSIIFFFWVLYDKNNYDSDDIYFLDFLIIYGAISFAGYISLVLSKEKLTNVKQVLYLSGAHMPSYWLGLFTVDLLKWIIFGIFAMVPFFTIFKKEELFYTYIYYFEFIISITFVSYYFGLIFEKEENSQTFLLLSLIIISLVLFIFTLLVFIFNLRGLLDKYFECSFYILPLDIFPGLGSLFSIMKISMFEILIKDNSKKGAFLVFVYESIKLLIQIILSGLIIVFSEVALFRKYWHSMVFSCCIKEELKNKNFDQYMTQNNPGENDYSQKVSSQTKLTIIIHGLKKTFCSCFKENVKAVNNLSLAMEPNEKFGLLGFNGSGKTTTFKSITNEIIYDEGSIKLFDKETKEEINEARFFIGYCPQENALFEFLTVEETLSYYKAIKKVKESNEKICKKFRLKNFLKTRCTNLSGGNKRKLLFCIALMGDPKALLLDEPSTGVDPESRRIMWKSIVDLGNKRSEYNLILSTHSMEEAEVLCDRIGWMKQGNFIYIGNPEKLKLEGSSGYYFTIKFIKQQLQGDYNETLNNLNTLVYGMNLIAVEAVKAPEWLSYCIPLLNVVNIIKSQCNFISLTELRIDFSLKLMLVINEKSKSELFSNVLNLKKKCPEITEVNISLEPLEDVLQKKDAQITISPPLQPVNSEFTYVNPQVQSEFPPQQYSPLYPPQNAP